MHSLLTKEELLDLSMEYQNVPKCISLLTSYLNTLPASEVSITVDPQSLLLTVAHDTGVKWVFQFREEHCGTA